MRTNADRTYWPEGWFREDRDTDPRFDQIDENLWLHGVPAGVWPDSDEAAKEMFLDNTANGGCPFQWLLDAFA